MEVSIEKCAIIIMKIEERETAEGIKETNEEILEKLGEKENLKYIGMVEVDIMKQAEMKETSFKKLHKNEKASWNQYRDEDLCNTPFKIFETIFKQTQE